MESALFKRIFAQGRARGEEVGEARGVAKLQAATIHKRLVRWLGSVDASLCQHVEAFANQPIIAAWYDEALDVQDSESAGYLLDKILRTPAPPSADGSSQAA